MSNNNDHRESELLAAIARSAIVGGVVALWGAVLIPPLFPEMKKELQQEGRTASTTLMSLGFGALLTDLQVTAQRNKRRKNDEDSPE